VWTRATAFVFIGWRLRLPRVAIVGTAVLVCGGLLTDLAAPSLCFLVPPNGLVDNHWCRWWSPVPRRPLPLPRLPPTGARAKNFKALEKTVEMMRLANVLPGAPTYNTLLKTLSRSQRFDEAVAMFAEMKVTVTPTKVTYNTMIDACAHRGDMDGASAYFDEMMAVGLQPDVITFTSLIKGFGRSGNAPRAVELFDAIREGGYALEERTYYAVINACLGAGDRGNARALLYEMLDAGFAVRTRTWTWLLECDLWADDEAAALRVLRDMGGAAVPMDGNRRARLLRECRKRGGFSRLIGQLQNYRHATD